MGNEKFQSKSITPVDDYKFTLSDELRKIAEEELRETDEIRENALRAIREWAMKNPRIVSLRLDSKFLLRFLRFKKFSIPMAQDALERYLVLRKFIHEGEFIYQKFDYLQPELFNLIDKGFCFALPQRDKLNRRVLFYRPRVFIPSKDSPHDIIRTPGIMFETMLEDEENQIRGCVHIIDASGMGLSFVTVLTPQETYRITKNVEKMVPLRHKELITTHVHPAFKIALDFALTLVSEKLRKRVKVYSKLEDQTSVDKSIFPKEYGGTIPMAEMIEMFKKELAEKRQILLSHDKMNVRFEMYPESVRVGSARSLQIPLDSPPEAFEEKRDMFGMNGVSGSFRKLEID